MKKLIYLCLVVLSVSIIHAETQYVEKSFQIGVNPVTGSYEVMTVMPNASQLSNLPVREGSTLPTVPSFFFYEPLTNQEFSFSTRIHPFPENTEEQDTARIVSSKIDPQEKYYIGDTQIPINVVDDEGNSVLKLNGYHQVLPSMQYFYPGFLNGTVVLDSVTFWLYSSPTRPIQNWFYFAITKTPYVVPNLGSDQFIPNSFSLSYSKAIDEQITDYIQMDANFVNSHTKDNGDGSFSIEATRLNLDGHPTLQTFDVTDQLLLVLFKDNPGDLKDTVNLIGAWEWDLSYAHAFAGVIKHFPDNNDSLGLLSQYRMLPSDPALFHQAYPGLDTNLRKNYRFLVYGRFTGEWSSVNKTEEYSDNFMLQQNSPNPVSTTTKIKFSTSNTSYVTLRVYNQLGELVATLVNETLTPGVYDTDFDGSNLAPGLYFYTLSSGNQTKTLPMMIAR